MIKFFLEIVLGIYNLCVFALLNVVMFFNHLWRPRRWEKVASPRPADRSPAKEHHIS